MKNSKLSMAETIAKLGVGWSEHHCGLVKEFIFHFGKTLGATVVTNQIKTNTVQYVMKTENIHLWGMADIPCLLISGDKPTETTQELSRFWRETSNKPTIPFVLAFSDCAFTSAQQVFPPKRCLVLSAQAINKLFSAESVCECLKDYLRKQIPIRRLIPYQILQPVEGNMFFGRGSILTKLLEEENTSFIIAGPSRIGKTSILTQYKRLLRLNSDPRCHRVFHISLYSQNSPTDEEVARRIAMAIKPSSKSYKMTHEDLLTFLNHQLQLSDGPLDLLIDEVDEVCMGKTFKVLGVAARQGLCRLVICGRGVLLKMLLRNVSYLACRTPLVRPGPLDVKAARRLLLRPLEDLGLKVRNPNKFVSDAFRLTGRLPHLVQFLGKRLSEICVEEQTTTVSSDHLSTLRWDHQVVLYLTNPITQIEDMEARLVAKTLLGHNREWLVVPNVQKLVARTGLNLSRIRILEILNRLVIDNVLTWNKGAFRIANEAMMLYARELRLLEKTRCNIDSHKKNNLQVV